MFLASLPIQTLLELFTQHDPNARDPASDPRAADDGTATAADRDEPTAQQTNGMAVRAGLARAEHLDTPGEDGLDWIFAKNLLG
jgi:hypothetical protein